MNKMGPFSSRLSVVVLVIMLGGHWIKAEESSITWADLGVDSGRRLLELNGEGNFGVTVVAKDGSGDSTTVQGAVDRVPDGNTRRVLIVIYPGIYREKVMVPYTKPYISFIGKDSSETVITWNSKASDKINGTSVGTMGSASVAIDSDYFCASGITFQNSAPNALAGEEGTQAVALRIAGDKAMFYRCRFLGAQDTLYDQLGRHYFRDCYIEGTVDFICGKAKSFYEGCTINVKAKGYGAIAASHRNSTDENSGFSFVRCRVEGSGKAYLGRAWGRYATTVYSFCTFADVIIPAGWDDWNDSSRDRTTWFAEYKCNGLGANMNGRVHWEKTMTDEEAKQFTTMDYIDGNQWLNL